MIDTKVAKLFEALWNCDRTILNPHPLGSLTCMKSETVAHASPRSGLPPPPHPEGELKPQVWFSFSLSGVEPHALSASSESNGARFGR